MKVMVFFLFEMVFSLCEQKKYMAIDRKATLYATFVQRPLLRPGDVTDRINLTPVALHEGHCLADTLFGGKDRAQAEDSTAFVLFVLFQS